MIHCDHKNGTNQVKVTFSLPVNGQGGELAVVGDFNGWDPKATPMRKRGSNRSASAFASVVVDSGKRYHFRYLRGDGRWLNDEAADAYEMGDRGEDNSVIDLTHVALVGGPKAK